MVAGLLAALGSVGKHHTDASEQLKTRRKRLEDIRLELARPFEHEGRLVELLDPQRALAKALDLDKDEAGSRSADAAEERLVADRKSTRLNSRHERLSRMPSSA